MLLSERTKYLEKLSYEKQMVFSVVSCERCYREVIKCFPQKHLESIFTKIISNLWEDIVNNKFQYNEVWKNYDLKVFKLIESKAGLNPSVIGQLARTLNLAIAAIDDKSNSAKLIANCADNASQIMSIIYENYEGERQKEIEWLTKALYLIAESEEVPTNYEWFLERIPDYERGQIYKSFKDFK